MRRRVLEPLLLVPGLAVEAAIRARNRLYSAGLLRARRLPHPVVSVGNLTMGGSGKTPLVLHLSERLAAVGAIPAVLSRGYGRRNPSGVHVLPPGNQLPDPALDLGDEPALIARRAPYAWIGVAADRYEVGLEISGRAGQPVFVLDDGFQHRRLARDLDILVVDTTQPLARGRVFPRGTLREPVRGIKRAQVVMLQGTDPSDSLERFIRSLHPAATILHSAQRIRAVVPFTSWTAGAQDGRLPAGSLFLAAAIGNPARFRRDVEAAGLEVAGSRFFRDHHRITPGEWRALSAQASAAGAAALLTTEKDAVKLRAPAPELPLLVAVQATEVREEDELLCLLRRIVGASR